MAPPIGGQNAHDGAQTAQVADFRAWWHDTNYLHDDGVNNMHDHNESATNVPPR